MAGRQPLSITSAQVLLVEGKDESYFFDALLKHMGIHDVQIVEYCGITNFKREFPSILRTTGFESVTKYAIVRDADNDSQAAFRSICYYLREEGEPCPTQPGEFATKDGRTVAVHIVPENSPTGMLEDVCAASVREHPAAECVEKYLNCLEPRLPKRVADQTPSDTPCFPRCRAKAWVKAFMAAMEEDVYSLGLAAQKRYWQFQHGAMEPLRRFLARFNDLPN